MNTRKKGQRTFAKAMRYAMSFPDTVALPIYQVSRFAQPQPCDVLLFRPDRLVRLVEVRTTQWGGRKPQTRRLTQIPGLGHLAQLWRFRRGTTLPDIREWTGTAWVLKDHPWESE